MKAEKFWAKVDKSGDCWLWTGARYPNGYGRCSVNRKDWLAHRYAKHLSGESVADAMVLHRCDNPPCVRPDHLFIGTAQDNVDDMLVKGRSKRSLSPDMIDRLSRGLEPGSASAIAKRFGVSPATISNFLGGTTFAAERRRLVDDEFDGL